LTNAPVAAANARARAVTDRIGEAVLGDRLLRGGLVVHGRRDHLDVQAVQLVQRPLERAELGVAVRAPRAPVEEHHAVVAGERARQVQSPPSGQGQGEGGEGVSEAEQAHLFSPVVV
jgi:hypothetical protein